MPFLDVPDGRLAYQIDGGSGSLVAQLHGLMSSREREASLGLDLGRALRGHRILRYDARGHGLSVASADPARFTWPSLATDLLALLDEVEPDRPVHGLGTSMGSATLLHAAVRAPHRFASLTLLVPPTAWETRRSQSQNYLANADLIEHEGLQAYLELGADVPDPPALAGSPRAMPSVGEPLLPSLLRGAASSNLPSLQDIGSIDVPTLILGWAGDPSHPVRTAELLHRSLPNSRRVVAQTPYGVMAWPGLFADHVTSCSMPRVG